MIEALNAAVKDYLKIAADMDMGPELQAQFFRNRGFQVEYVSLRRHPKDAERSKEQLLVVHNGQIGVAIPPLYIGMLELYEALGMYFEERGRDCVDPIRARHLVEFPILHRHQNGWAVMQKGLIDELAGAR